MRQEDGLGTGVPQARGQEILPDSVLELCAKLQPQFTHFGNEHGIYQS